MAGDKKKYRKGFSKKLKGDRNKITFLTRATPHDDLFSSTQSYDCEIESKSLGKCNYRSKSRFSNQLKDSSCKGGPPKAARNAIGFEYPAAHLQVDGLHPQLSSGPSGGGNILLDESCPTILVPSLETPIYAYVDQKPSCCAHNECAYSYDLNMVLNDESHRGLGFSGEYEETPDLMGSLKKAEGQEGSYLASPLCNGEMNDDDQMLCEMGGHVEHKLGEKSPIYENLKFLSIKEVQSNTEGACCPGKGDSDTESVDEREIGSSESPILKISAIEVEDLVPEKSSHKNSGFLSIGGVKLYTSDISDVDEENLEIYKNEGCMKFSDLSSDSDDSVYLSDTRSDIDDEVAQDYIDGIGGGDTFIDVKWAKHETSVSGGDSSSDSSTDKSSKKLGGVALQEASKEYGIMKRPPKDKLRAKSCKSGAATGACSLEIDGFLLMKDVRSAAERKHNVGFPRSCAQKSRTKRAYPGEKKKHRKEKIALKRRERMMSRGLDLQQINVKLEQMVLSREDMVAFQPMHPRDCSQVQRLARIYRLSSGRHGSGKKRFVTVARTEHTSMPSSTDKLRLVKLLGANCEDDDFVVHEDYNYKFKRKPSPSTRSPTGPDQSAHPRASKKSGSRHGGNEGSAKKHKDRNRTSLAKQPVSFISCGVMPSGHAEVDKDSREGGDAHREIKGVGKFGAFEEHTKGFGSKMMAKMGFEGGGLGKDGQGMVEPIEVMRRPKSLGLGVEFSETADSTVESPGTGSGNRKKKSPSIGAFEKHTKGFGSKMMAKMGFVEGMGLGRDSQGIVSPLMPNRRPKSRGLGVGG